MPFGSVETEYPTRAPFRALLGRVAIGGLLLLHLLFRSLWLEKLYFNGLAVLVRRTGLFDDEYYLHTYPDVANAGWQALTHYVAHGNREMRSPNPLFQPLTYLKYGSRYDALVNALLHYGWVGRYLGYSPSPWFDVDYYLGSYQDVTKSGRDPLRHFLEHGAREGRNPSSHFDIHRYLQDHPEVVTLGENPLLHYLRIGRFEEGAQKGGTPHGESGRSPERGGRWASLPRKSAQSEADVDVIIPVYRNREQTLACIRSVLSSTNQSSYELVVLNDASPDEELVADLHRLAEDGYISYVENSFNQGFVRTVNCGMRLHPARDVVLLNSDTEVYGDWLDRLRKVVLQEARVGTVTPLSNNATLCSYPLFMQDNPVPLEVTYAEMDRAASMVNEGKVVETPTAVGFCMYIRRDCLNECGYFDEVSFGHGYGEENDFSQRILGFGWRNLIAASVFVRHWGGTSFKGAKAKLAHRGLQIINQRYPDYRKDVRRFIKEDSLLAAREALDWARLEAGMTRHNVLMIRNRRGDKEDRAITLRSQQHLSEGRGAFLLEVGARDAGRIRLSHAGIDSLPNLPCFNLAPQGGLVNALHRLKIATIEVHNLSDMSPHTRQDILKLAQSIPARVEFYLYDYWAMCPKRHLVRQGQYCGEPDESSCDKCLQAGRHLASDIPRISSWRESSRKLLEQADAIYVPHEYVQKSLSEHFPGLGIFVWSMEPDGGIIERLPLSRHRGNLFRVVIVGALTRLRGYDTVLGCATLAKSSGRPIEFVLMGSSPNDEQLIEQGVKVIGYVPDSNKLKRIAELAPDLIWIASISPETYSEALTLALRTPVEIAAFDMGPVAARLRNAGRERFLWPREWVRQPEKILSALLGGDET